MAMPASARVCSDAPDFYAHQVHRELLDDPHRALIKYRERISRELQAHGLTSEAVRGRHVLDIGTGLQSVVFAELGCARVSHIDIELGHVQWLREYCRRFGLSNISSRQADVTEGLADITQVDLAFVDGVLHHLSRPERFIGHLVGAMAPRGEMMFRCYRADSFSRFVVAHLRPFAQLTTTDALRWAVASFDASGAAQQFESDLIDDLMVKTWSCFEHEQFVQDANLLGFQWLCPDGTRARDFDARDENFRVRWTAGPGTPAEIDTSGLALARSVDPRTLPFPHAMEIANAFSECIADLHSASPREVATIVVGLYRMVRRFPVIDAFEMRTVTLGDVPHELSSLRCERLLAMLARTRA